MKPLLRGMRKLIRRQPLRHYDRQPPLVLVNGLAEQSESWFCNVERGGGSLMCIRRIFWHTMPSAIHRRIRRKIAHRYRLSGSATAGVPGVVRSAARRIGWWPTAWGAKLPSSWRYDIRNWWNGWRYCAPSGLGEKEQLPIIEGVRRGNSESVVHSVFYRQLDLNPRADRTTSASNLPTAAGARAY